MLTAVLTSFVILASAVVVARLRRPEPKRVPVETDRKHPRRRQAPPEQGGAQ